MSTSNYKIRKILNNVKIIKKIINKTYSKTHCNIKKIINESYSKTPAISKLSKKIFLLKLLHKQDFYTYKYKLITVNNIKSKNIF